MNVLLLGGGGREHAIGWKLAQSPRFGSLISAPGNPGLADLGEVLPGFPHTDPEAVTELARDRRVDLVVVGEEAPLAAGVVDVLTAAGIPAFGPTRANARLESSKSFAKDVMRRAGVPTGAAHVFDDAASALEHLETAPRPYVVKADGLAAGKGVLVTGDVDAARAWVHRCFGGGFGEAGNRVVVEEHLTGDEVSVFAICDGTRALPLAPARDHKRLGDGDTGPNTGGMGCFSPVDDLPPDLVETTMRDIVEPVLATLSADGTPYRGFLYAGLMLTGDGPQVIEFNCRLGDPEAQVLLPRFEGDLLELAAAGAAGSLPDHPLSWSPQAAVAVALAAPGYPEAPQKGSLIEGLDQVPSDTVVFHAGTARTDDGLVTAGGRVLYAVALGDDLEQARHRAYATVDRIRFDGMQYRTDIGGGARTEIERSTV